MAPDPNADMALDQRILFRAASFGRTADRWWMWPLRWWLRDRQSEMSAWAREARRLVRSLDEIAEDAREQMQAAMPHEEPLMCDSPTALAQLDQCLARWKR